MVTPLPGAFSCPVVYPGYESLRRGYNARFDPHPSGIVLAQTVEDVVAAVRCARDAGPPIVARSGGHSYEG